LPVQDLVRELVIAHARPGLHKVYDQHSYQDEKRECLTLWEGRLKGILAPSVIRVLLRHGPRGIFQPDARSQLSPPPHRP
jgi:hypothetical protein